MPSAGPPGFHPLAKPTPMGLVFFKRALDVVERHRRLGRSCPCSRLELFFTPPHPAMRTMAQAPRMH